MGKITQKDLVLEYLQKYKKITDREAYTEFGIRRLGARIWDLREAGHMIRTVNTTKPNRYGKNTTFATYILED